MYLKSTHTQLTDGGHQWEVTLFCSAESNSIGSVDIIPKSKVEQPPQPSEKDRKKGKKFLCFNFGGKSNPLSEKDGDVQPPKGCCACTIM
ncbi:14107_t:CDS:2 [Rhizophagus irregularis]|nr:14107_t:CDS:2 [Rhizophagus irregularis]